MPPDSDKTAFDKPGAIHNGNAGYSSLPCKLVKNEAAHLASSFAKKRNEGKVIGP